MKKKQEFKLNKNLFQAPEKCKEELIAVINEENHRNNVDRAKSNHVLNILTIINFIKWY